MYLIGKDKVDPQLNVSLADLEAKPTVTEQEIKIYAPYLLKFSK
jgi:hypothetical protein